MIGIHGISRRRLRIFLAVLVALVMLTTGVVVAPRAAVWLWPVDHTVAETVVPDREVPGTVSEVAWEWRPPEDELIDDVLPVPNGAVAVSDSGVTALEGVAGEEMWRYRRADATVRSANVTPDGESVVVSFSGMDVEEDARVETVVVLDARSGEIRDEYELPSPSVEESASRFSYVTDEVFLAPGENAMGIGAFALEGADRVWSYEGGDADEWGPRVVTGDAVITTGTVSRHSGSG
jgi:outer membrane protein assembly factor BamB